MSAIAPVLVLDEPTAHLDEATAEALVSDVLAAAEDRSVLLITHRLEGLDLVDDVVRLDVVSVRSAGGGLIQVEGGPSALHSIEARSPM